VLDDILLKGVELANEALAKHIEKNPETEGMGSTLIVVVIQGQDLSWVSVGDSPLYLWRAKKCYQLNQDHSMAPAIDQMALDGMMTEETALNHPDRNILTSAMNGSAPALLDAGNDPVKLLPGDIVVLSSDGLQTISDAKISAVLNTSREYHPPYITAALLNSVLDLDDPNQDNIGVVTVKVEKSVSNQANKKISPEKIENNSDDGGKAA
jgi:serine/threonine protein phosphatase PrpC